MIDKLMRSIWETCRWIWVVIIIAIGVAFVSAVLVDKPGRSINTTFGTIVDWLIQSHTLASGLILLACYLFLGLSALSGIYRLFFWKKKLDPSHQHTAGILQEMKTLTHMYANDMRQLHDGLAGMFQMHEHNLSIISNSLQMTSNSLKILEQQALLTPLEELSEIAIQQDQQINALSTKIEQDNQQLQRQLSAQKHQEAQNINACMDKIEQETQKLQKMLMQQKHRQDQQMDAITRRIERETHELQEQIDVQKIQNSVDLTIIEQDHEQAELADSVTTKLQI